MNIIINEIEFIIKELYVSCSYKRCIKNDCCSSVVCVSLFGFIFVQCEWETDENIRLLHLFMSSLRGGMPIIPEDMR